MTIKIYTKTGDGGETGLFGGRRVPKDSLRVETYGAVDELNSLIGVCRSLNTVQEIDAVLGEIQNGLFTLGSDLATPADPPRKDVPRIGAAEISGLERHIDAIDPLLEPLRNFILPGGSQRAAMLHLARSVCRRAERLVVRLTREERLPSEPTIYLNRLSDLLFVLARRVNALGGSAETLWRPSGRP